MSFAVTPDVPPQSGALPQQFPALVSGVASLAASASPQAIDSFAIADFGATKYVLLVEQGATLEVIEVLLMASATNTFIESYGDMSSSGMPTFTLSASVAAGFATLYVTLLTVAAGAANFQAIRVAV